jgi:hypothetical protein
MEFLLAHQKNGHEARLPAVGRETVGSDVQRIYF